MSENVVSALLDAGIFGGCKLALVHDGNVLVYLRDNMAGIPAPRMLDFPGGAREGDASPEQSGVRSRLAIFSQALSEEFGICLPAERLIYRRKYTIPHSGNPVAVVGNAFRPK